MRGVSGVWGVRYEGGLVCVGQVWGVCGGSGMRGVWCVGVRYEGGLVCGGQV